MVKISDGVIFKSNGEVEINIKEGRSEGVGESFRRPRRLASTRGLRSGGCGEKAPCGWVRVYSGYQEDRGTLVYLTPDTTVRDVGRDLVLPENLTIWIQHAGGPSKRLSSHDRPLKQQDDFLKKLGYDNESRRTRMGIDPELRHLIRFHTGPAAPSTQLGAYLKSGEIQILKGLVFPQWRRRAVAIISSRLFLYPGTDNQEPEVLELSGAEVSERAPRGGRFVIRVAHKDADSMRHLFFGFNHTWERDLWFGWFRQATQLHSTNRLDLTDSGLERLPDSLCVFHGLKELRLSRNRLGVGATPEKPALNLELLWRLPKLKRLALSCNEFRYFPLALLQLSSLLYLDLSSNGLKKLPEEIAKLSSLEELRLDRNALTDLPKSLSCLYKLRVLTLSHNVLSELPLFLLTMRALSLLDFQGNRVENGKIPVTTKEDNASLGKINLRANLLKGNIILGNYGNLTQLDVSENSIETLDLSALTKLESVQCSKNRLVELTLCGKTLTSLIAGNNKLKKLIVIPLPLQLKHLDVSYNDLEMLPDWIANCSHLRTLFASHNKLKALPHHMFCNDHSSLQTLQLSYNKITCLPSVVRHIPLQELFLQSNSLTILPANFFATSPRMRILNLSNNRVCNLPSDFDNVGDHPLEKLYLTANLLSDNALEVMGRFNSLRVLHAAYNCISVLPESCIAVWTELEELVLSGNKLQYLPDNIINLKHLRVLRVHSNRLQASPCFSKMASLKVLDLAHNRLDRINLATLVPQHLQFLDLSCNSRLYVDPRQFQFYRSQRPMSLVDVSGQNRTCLPSTPYHEDGSEIEPPWKIGFSETPGLREKLYITQIRLPAFCNTEGLFGMFDGSNNNEVPDVLVKAVPRILLEERTVKETANEYMKYTMLSAHRELKEKGQKYGVCGTLCHITKTRPATSQMGNGFLPGSQRYIMRVCSVGEARAILCRRSGTVHLTQSKSSHSQSGCSTKFPLVIPDPNVTEILLDDQDEFLVIANKRFWEVIDVEETVKEVRDVGNAILAAKKLQDLAQSYGSEENISVIVVKFSDLTSDVDQLIRELRHTIRKNKQQQQETVRQVMSHCGCCCRDLMTPTSEGMYDNRFPAMNGINSRVNIPNGMPQYRNGGYRDLCNFPDTDRSSPSGQSDRASSDCVSRDAMYSVNKSIDPSFRQSNKPTQCDFIPKSKTSHFQSNSATLPMQPHQQSVLMHENGIKKMTAIIPSLERRSYRDSKRSYTGVAKAIRVKTENFNGNLADGEEEETSSDKSGTQLSEEQFKCWEYMLEQNSQLLFDKELNTLSRSVGRQKVPRPDSSAVILDPSWPRPTPLQHRAKGLSRSSPHLSEPCPSPAPFLSRHFGSARSFNPVPRHMPRFGSARHILNGGPNAAYFGSLQRLMPYNLEYNFSLIQEKGTNHDSIDLDNRMHQYWDVTTTEL